jgi:hypothetical protein
MQGVEEGTFLNGTDIGNNSTELAHFTEQTERALNMTWSACCTGEIPDFDSLDFVEKHHHENGDHEEGEQPGAVDDVDQGDIPSSRLRGEQDRDFTDEWREMSDEEKKEKIDEICTALTDALEKEGESLHCDDPNGFDTFYHKALQLIVRALGVYGIMMIMASCIQFITMLASCCLVCAGSDHPSSTNVNYTTTHNVTVSDHRSGANSHYTAMRSPLVKEEVVTGNPVF